MARKSKNIQYYEAVGRRKEAVARVRLYLVGKDKKATVGSKKHEQGAIIVNDKPADTVFTHQAEQRQYMAPLQATSSLERFVVSVIIRGGGRSGQLDALVHGISRALTVLDETTNKPVLRQLGLLTRDPRAKERRKVGTGGKARRKKQSPKR